MGLIPSAVASGLRSASADGKFPAREDGRRPSPSCPESPPEFAPVPLERPAPREQKKFGSATECGRCESSQTKHRNKLGTAPKKKCDARALNWSALLINECALFTELVTLLSEKGSSDFCVSYLF